MSILNIDKRLNIVEGLDKKYKPRELSLYFVEMLSENGYKIVEFNDKGAIKYLKASINGQKIEIYFLIRNIVHSGWKEKPHIKRIQVQNFSINNPELFKPLNNSSFFFFVGYYNFDGNPLFVYWDPGRYTHHITNRSCYVYLNTLVEAYKKGYIETVNMNKRVWVLTSENFNLFLNNYKSVIDINKN